MIRCNTCRTMMAEALYDELSPARQEEFQAHVAACADCAREFAGLGATLRMMDNLEPANPPAGYWAGYWERLQRRLEPAGSENFLLEWWRRIRFPVVTHAPAWAPLAAALMLIVTGVFIGRALYLDKIVTTGTPGQTATIIDAAVLDEFNQMFSQYISRSRVALMGLDNFDTAEDQEMFDLPRHQLVYQDIIRQGRNLQRHKAASQDIRFILLVAEIERVLLQIANSDDEDMDWVLQIARQGIEQNSILLKITLTEIHRQSDPEPEGQELPPAKKSSILI